MQSLSWILILTIAISFTFEVHGDDDKNGKTLSKVADYKAKLARTAIEPTSVENPPFEEGLDNESISVLGISVPPEFQNDTVQIDHHVYYNSTFYSDPEVAKKLWIDIDSYSSVVTHEMLSNSHRQATTIDLKFDFPFYGSFLKNVTIATGGFLYTGDYLHNWIAATQYVAPLMANFDTSQAPDSLIKYADNGTSFTAEWSKVYIKNRMNDGAFTFQVTLFKNGDIVFAYRDIPYTISNISDSSHPVKIGISDAYILERTLFFLRRKTIYEYHRIDMLKKNIGNNTALYFAALPTCLDYKDCTSCLAANPKLECNWCQAVNRCSDGVDRLRQSWITNACPLHKETTCPPAATTEVSHLSTDKSQSKGSVLTSPNSIIETSTKYMEKTSKQLSSSSYNTEVPSSGSDPSWSKHQEASHYIHVQENEGISGISVGAIVTIVIFIAAVIGTTGWIFYAYKFPQSPSGQFLIKYRPSQWTLKKEDNSITTSSRHL